MLERLAIHIFKNEPQVLHSSQEVTQYKVQNYKTPEENVGWLEFGNEIS